LAEDDTAAGPYTPPPYVGSAKFLVPEGADESTNKVGAPLSTYHAKAEAVASLETHSINNAGRRYLRRA